MISSFRTFRMAVAVASMSIVTAAAAAAQPAPISLHHPVDLGDGRSLNLVCMGQGPTTVVFEQGLGGSILDWGPVVAPVSSFARACFYDRAGYGYSAPSGRPADATNAVEDLHALLKHAGVKGRVVMVGHSLGGLFATLYADRYGGDLVGLVLVDPAIPGQQSQIRAHMSPAEKQAADTDSAHQLDAMRKCADEARSGALKPDAPMGCFPPLPAGPAEVAAYLSHAYLSPTRYEAIVSEAQNFAPAGDQVDQDSIEESHAARSFGRLPVVVLTSDPALVPPQAASKEMLAAFKAGHDALAARSSRGESVIVPKAGHYIQKDQPSAVVGAIRKVAQLASQP